MNVDALLRSLADRYETANFLQGDPSWFMHQVLGRSNREIVAFIAAALSYGQRTAFMPKIEELLSLTEDEPDRWVRSGAFVDTIPNNAQTFYRLTDNRQLYGLLSGLQTILAEHGTLGDFIHTNATTGIEAVRLLTSYFSDKGTSPLIPQNSLSACKRLCMFLRWMVRDGSPVDLGLWSDFIDRRTLIMPLDTHVLSMACRFRLIPSKTASMATAQKLTGRMLKVFPDDPLRGDFALFGLGITV